MNGETPVATQTESEAQGDEALSEEDGEEADLTAVEAATTDVILADTLAPTVTAAVDYRRNRCGHRRVRSRQPPPNLRRRQCPRWPPMAPSPMAVPYESTVRAMREPRPDRE